MLSQGGLSSPSNRRNKANKAGAVLCICTFTIRQKAPDHGKPAELSRCTSLLCWLTSH